MCCSCACGEGYERKVSEVRIETCFGGFDILCFNGDRDGGGICVFKTILDFEEKVLCIADWVRR